MSVQRRVNQLSQMREECSDLRAIESAASADFDTLIQSFITGAGNPYIVNGFALNMASNPIGGAASNLQVIVAEGALLHTTASQSGTFYLVPAGTPNVTLNAATVANVTGAFVPSSNNYIGIDYYRFQDTATDTQRYLWDPTSKEEDQAIAPAAIVLSYEFVITSSIWASNILPIAIVVTDSSNNVVSITDSRPLLFRLGTGGVNPNPYYVFPWPEGTTENPVTTISNGSNPFYGGDKGITDLKDFIDAVETGFLYLGGGPYWYSFFNNGPSGSLSQLREDVANTLLTGTGNITHSATVAGRMNWTSSINLKIVGSGLSYSLATNPTGTSVTLADDEVAYLSLVRDVPLSPNLVFTHGSTTVTSIGNVAWTSNIQSLDWINKESDTHAGYSQVQTIINSFTVTLAAPYAGTTSSGVTGDRSVYAYGDYTLPGVSGNSRDLQISAIGSVPISPNTFWIFTRSDDSGSIPRVYVKWLDTDLQQGDTEEISGPQIQNVLTYIGSPIESATLPGYVSAWNVYEGNSPTVLPQIVSITTGAANTMISGEYFELYSSGSNREYYVWVKKDGTGSDPTPVANATGIEWDISTGQTSTQTAAALVTSLNNTFFKDFTATNAANILTVTNNSAGTTAVPANVSIGSPFSISVTQSGTGSGNYAIQDGDNLTLAIKKLDEAVGSIASAANQPGYDEIVTIVASGESPPNSLNGPISSGTNIMLPPNSREGNTPAFYTVNSGKLEIFLNGQKLILDDGYSEVGSDGAPSDEIEILFDLEIDDELEFTFGGGGAGGAGGGIGPQGPAGPAGPSGPPGSNAFGNPVSVSTKTGNYQLLLTDFVILGDCTSNNITVTLPLASSGIGRIYFIKKVDASANTLTLKGTGSEQIDSTNTIVMPSQWMIVTVVSSGTAWYVL